MARSPGISHFWVLAIVSTVYVCYAGPPEGLPPSNCLRCHAEYAIGDYVHPAVILGCTNCHQVAYQGGRPRVLLKTRDGGMCVRCHLPQQFQHAHLPYAVGMCTRCHDPHKSDNRMLLRRAVNELCLECHLQNSGELASRDVPTIDLSPDNSMGHPFERHPVKGTTDPVRGGEMSCMSCHVAHGGTLLHYLKMGSEIPEDALNRNSETKDMCHLCHLRLWGLEVGGTGEKKRK